MIIGLTGQTGSGKSTLCEYLEKKGFFICSCDEVAKEVRKSEKIKAKIADVFGFDIINPGGEIDRRKLAERAFSSREATQKLNSLMLPEILSLSFEKIEAALKSGYEYAVLDAPTLFESGADKKCDFTVFITADKEERIKRILKRDSISRTEALQRMSVQSDDEFYAEKSDYVIINDSLSALPEKAETLLRLLDDYKSSRS